MNFTNVDKEFYGIFNLHELLISLTTEYLHAKNVDMKKECSSLVTGEAINKEQSFDTGFIKAEFGVLAHIY